MIASTCPSSGLREDYESRTSYGEQMVVYRYCDTDGEVFTTTAPTLDIARGRRDLWLDQREDAKACL